MEEPRECVIRRPTKCQERQGEETYLSIDEGTDENNQDNGTGGRAIKTRAYNRTSERTCNSLSNKGEDRQWKNLEKV